MGCSIRNEDIVYIMYLVTRSLIYDQKKIINNILAIIKQVILIDTTGTDFGKLELHIKDIEEKRRNLIRLYISGSITREEFETAMEECSNKIASLQSILNNSNHQKEIIKQQQDIINKITEVVNGILSGMEYEDWFYKEILDKIVVNDKDHIDVYLKYLPFKWSYTAERI